MNYFRRSRSTDVEKKLSPAEQQSKINEVRELLGPLTDQVPNLCSDDSISRYLRARNWDAEKASQMLKDTLKWRLNYKPETISWEDVADEAETGKIYKANYLDKYGRTVLVMRPGFQNTNGVKGQIRFLVYCMEKAIMSLPENQEQMVWLIDFQGWTMASTSLKATRETAHILQSYFPERLALGILYNPPKIFESFWKIVKPFLEAKTYKKVKFVYSDSIESRKTMMDLFDMDTLESSFGGRSPTSFNFEKYGEQMKEEDGKMSALLQSGGSIGLSQESLRLMLKQSGSTSLDDAKAEDSSESFYSTDNDSPRRGGANAFAEMEMKGLLDCKNTAVTKSEVHKPELITMKESA